MVKYKNEFYKSENKHSKKAEQERKMQWIESAKKEAAIISNDIDEVIEFVKTGKYSLEMAKDEFLWRVLDLENHYINTDVPEINEVYKEVFEKAKAALERVKEKMQEEGLDK